MSRATIREDLQNMLSDMTIVNGYYWDYTPVKSVNNDSAKQSDVPWIGLYFGEEESITEGVGMNELRNLLPVIIVARINATHDFRSEIEYEEDIQRSKAIEDIKKRFFYAYREITGNCTQIADDSWLEFEAPDDSNKHELFAVYGFAIIYKQKMN